MAVDQELEDLDAMAWKTMAYALQRAVLDQFKMIEDLRDEVAVLHKITRHLTMRADETLRQMNHERLQKMPARLPNEDPFGDGSAIVYEFPLDAHHWKSAAKQLLQQPMTAKEVYGQFGNRYLVQGPAPDPKLHDELMKHLTQKPLLAPDTFDVSDFEPPDESDDVSAF